jgi:hypothetical protein
MGMLAAGFTAGQGVGGYAEDLEAEGNVITVNGSDNDKLAPIANPTAASEQAAVANSIKKSGKRKVKRSSESSDV